MVYLPEPNMPAGCKTLDRQYTMSTYDVKMNRCKADTFKVSTAYQPPSFLSKNFQLMPQQQRLFYETCHTIHSSSGQDWALDTKKVKSHFGMNWTRKPERANQLELQEVNLRIERQTVFLHIHWKVENSA